MVEIKQTAVEWLVKIYLQTNKIDSFDIEQAKALEKQQIMIAYEQGDIQLVNSNQYYNNTYGKADSN